jgi:hypothetical protein
MDSFRFARMPSRSSSSFVSATHLPRVTSARRTDSTVYVITQVSSKDLHQRLTGVHTRTSDGERVDPGTKDLNLLISGRVASVGRRSSPKVVRLATD